MKQFNSLLIAFAVLIQLTKCHVIVYRSFTNQVIEEFYDLPAQFGPSLPSNGLRVRAVESLPKDACNKTYPPPSMEPEDPFVRWVAVIARTNCTFEQKIRNAQEAGYDAAIVYNIGSDELEQMSAKNGDGITIPSIFVGETTGRIILAEYLYSNDDGYVLVLNDELPFNINTHLILPFSILVGLCFIIMIVYMIYKCAREQRRLRQHRLPKRLLKKIPIIKFIKGHHTYDTCVICLEDYAEGDKLRVLPCAHAYHCQCIDQWLTKNRRVCPICKRKVFARGESRRSRRRNVSSDSMSDSETDDTTPLLNPVENANNHGTFSVGQNTNAENNVDDRQQLLDDQNVSSASNARITSEDQFSPSSSTSQRVNPFDREPNLPPNLVQDLGSGPSFWNHPLLRFFRRRRNYENQSIYPRQPTIMEQTSQIEHQQNDDNSSVAVNLPPRPSSNNILNANLSGSFKESDEDDRGSTIYEPNSHNTASKSLNIAEEEQNPDSVFIQTPTRGGIGVVALPNTSFHGYEPPPPPLPHPSERRHPNGNSRDFIV